MCDDCSPGWVHKLPPSRQVDRLEFLVSAVAGKSVVHIGFAAAPSYDELFRRGELAHLKLAREARSIVGLDLDAYSVKAAQEAGYEAYEVDCQDRAAVKRLGLQPAEVVVAGELIEHLDRPGAFLDAAHELVADDGLLIVTTPNASSLRNPLSAIANYELINPDHVSVYSWYTLKNILSRHGWSVVEFLTCEQPPLSPRPQGIKTKLQAQALIAFFRAQSLLARWRPFAANGLMAVCRSTDRTASQLSGV